MKFVEEIFQPINYGYKETKTFKKKIFFVLPHIAKIFHTIPYSQFTVNSSQKFFLNVNIDLF